MKEIKYKPKLKNTKKHHFNDAIIESLSLYNILLKLIATKMSCQLLNISIFSSDTYISDSSMTMTNFILFENT